MTAVPVVPHYVGGHHRTPTDAGTVRHDATTGAEIYRVTRAPVDPAAVLGYARIVAGPALRRLDHPDRATQLAELARQLARHRDEFARLAIPLGATRADTANDLDAGLRALRAYARAGTRELPRDTLIPSPGADAPARDGNVASQALRTGLRGVALQINGFARPLSTMLDAFARAHLAGMPSIVHPSRRTAQLTAYLVDRIADAGIIGRGTLQLVTGPTDFLDHLTPQDLLSFTGTAATARRLHGRIAHLPGEPHADFATETLTCAVLGPDATPDAPLFAMFVDRLVATVTGHAGQTPAAPRRVFVPRHLLGPATDAAAAALAAVAVGPPDGALDGSPGARMGPLIDREHRRTVRERVARLASTAARVVLGEPSDVGEHAWEQGGEYAWKHVAGQEPPGGDTGWDSGRDPGGDSGGDTGAFMPPVLLVADDPARRELHEVEAFGPVTTLIPYRTADDLADALALGRGRLSGWIATEDPRTAHELTRALAPSHARIDIVAPDAPPREAGTADPLRRLRSHLTETTTVSAPPRILGAVTNRWIPGAPRTGTDTHPLRRYLKELRVGDSVTAGPRTVTRDDIRRFADLTGDRYYAHTDDAAAARNPLFGGIVAHGYLVVSLATGLFATPEPGPVLANYGLEHLRFSAPVRPGDALTVTLTAKEITPRPNTGHGEVRWHVEVANQLGRAVARYDLLTMTAEHPRA